MKLTFTLLCLFISTWVLAQETMDLTGTWADDKNFVSYDFKADGSCVFEQNGYPIFIKNFMVDEGKSPIWIDFTIEQGGQRMSVPGLLKIIDENTIWIEQFPPMGNHPTNFSEDNTRNIHVLKRKD